jgi:hypothetical protein
VAAEQRGVLGESQQEGVEAVGERGGDASRPGEAGEASGGAAARQRRSRGRRRGGPSGAAVKFQKLQGPHYNIEFPTILKLK